MISQASHLSPFTDVTVTLWPLSIARGGLCSVIEKKNNKKEKKTLSHNNWCNATEWIDGKTYVKSKLRTLPNISLWAMGASDSSQMARWRQARPSNPKLFTSSQWKSNTIKCYQVPVILMDLGESFNNPRESHIVSDSPFSTLKLQKSRWTTYKEWTEHT